MDAPNERSPNENRILSVALTVAAVLFSIIWRIVPHYPPNTTSVGALGLFGGARLRWWQGALSVLVVMTISDAILRQWYNYEPFSPWVYGSFLVNVLIGTWLSRWGAVWCVAAGSVLASVQFYLVTNFGTWFSTKLYPPTLAGLLDCYVQGLPYFGYTLAGDVVCSALLFGAYALLTRALAAKEEPVAV